MSFLANFTGNRALRAHNKGDYSTALKLYEEAYKGGMDKPILLRGYAILLIRTSQFDKAEEVLGRLKTVPGFKETDLSEMNTNMAVVVWQKGDIDKALDLLRGELKKRKTGTIYSILGYLMIEKGDPEAALAFNKEALEYDDNDPVFLDNMGQVLYRLYGDKEGAKPYFERAIEQRPGSIDTCYFLAQYAIEAGDKEKARKYLETAKKGRTSPLNYATPVMIEKKLKSLGK